MKYELHQMQALVEDAIDSSRSRHSLWRKMENLLTTGDSRDGEGERTANSSFTAGRANSDAVHRTVNVLLPHITLIENTIVQNDPSFVVYAHGAGADYYAPTMEDLDDLESRAKIGEALLYFYWKKTHAQDDTGHAAKSQVRLGKGFVKVAWSSVKAEYEKDQVDLDLEAMGLVSREQEAALAEGRPMTGLAGIQAQVQATGEMTVANMPFVSWVSPYNIFVGRGARDVYTCNWVCERIIKPRWEVEENPAYKDFFKEGRELNTAFGQRMSNQALQTVGPDYDVFEEIELFEFYDLVNRRVVHFQLNTDTPLFDGPIPWSHPYGPYVEFNNYKRDGDDFWGFGELLNTVGPQLMLRDIIKAQISDIQRSGNKYFINKQYLTKEVREGLAANAADVAIPVNKPIGQSWDDVMTSVPRTGAQQEIWEYKSILEGDIRTVLGLNEFQAGMSGADRMSATAAAAVDGNSVVRVQDKLRSYERGVAKVGQLILLLAQEYLDEPTAVRIGGAQGGKWMNDVTKEDIMGEYNVEVTAGSTATVNPAAVAQKGQELLNLLPVIANAIQDPNLRPALKSALRAMGHNPDAILPSETALQAQAQAAASQQAGPQGPAPQASGPTGEPGQHPVEELAALGGAPVPAATSGGLNF